MKKSIEKIIPRPMQPGMVGDGFRVFHYFPGGPISQRRISPFLLLDYAAEFEFPPTEHLRGVDVHPHKGFETVTIAYKGAVEHHDSAGNHGIIYPGEVQWMTAGAGILHKEYHEREFSRQGGPFEMIQLWVNLPAKYKQELPHYQALSEDLIRKIELPNKQGVLRIIAGAWKELKGPAKTYTPINLFDIRLNKGGDLEMELDQSHNTALLVLQGQVAVNGATIPEQQMALFGNDGTVIQVHASKDSVLLLMSGEPIDEPIASYGPFVMNTQAELMEAMEEFRAGKFGSLS
ncbi:pirin family protein [Flavihumibacter sp. CACIAM 22H1]|uniref:pirin family protein n=1 Tax=Flavihumibacter sp. CACIAM 22H1 TaxID=1812911 RepID=UPI0007A85EA7|nr:pirin family protein [Flavihumibacter sp. CACIAM 22H1]KYP13345.1 MAG: short-chain dehydrogenase [Flavihumibacter sp. CACIAM 22H1]